MKRMVVDGPLVVVVLDTFVDKASTVAADRVVLMLHVDDQVAVGVLDLVRHLLPFDGFSFVAVPLPHQRRPVVALENLLPKEQLLVRVLELVLKVDHGLDEQAYEAVVVDCNELAKPRVMLHKDWGIAVVERSTVGDSSSQQLAVVDMRDGDNMGCSGPEERVQRHHTHLGLHCALHPLRFLLPHFPPLLKALANGL